MYELVSKHTSSHAESRKGSERGRKYCNRQTEHHFSLLAFGHKNRCSESVKSAWGLQQTSDLNRLIEHKFLDKKSLESIVEKKNRFEKSAKGRSI